MFCAWVSTGRLFKVAFDRGDTLHYSLHYSDDGGNTWQEDVDVYGCNYPNGRNATGTLFGGTNLVTVRSDCIFKQAKCFILWDFWGSRDNSFLVNNISVGDEFAFTMDQTSSTVEIPVYFSGVPDAEAVTIDNVNSVVDGGTIITGMTHESNTGNVFSTYIRDAYENLAGYTDVIFADSRFYANWNGDLHCGSNTER